LNDDFTGGETFVDDYVNKPKTGSAIIFPSNYYHGVHKILSGQRVTFAMWFTLDPNKIEKLI
jgi:predicted 2-oxoglutarate/Fe(II)-dependent dioxygenase YbiX